MDIILRSVEELRVFTEEELVEKALEALKVFIFVFPHEKKTQPYKFVLTGCRR